MVSTTRVAGRMENSMDKEYTPQLTVSLEKVSGRMDEDSNGSASTSKPKMKLANQTPPPDYDYFSHNKFLDDV